MQEKLENKTLLRLLTGFYLGHVMKTGSMQEKWNSGAPTLVEKNYSFIVSGVLGGGCGLKNKQNRLRSILDQFR